MNYLHHHEKQKRKKKRIQNTTVKENKKFNVKEFMPLCVEVKELTEIIKGIKFKGGICQFNNKIKKVCVELY
jgi:hypothetical protein